MVEGMVPLLPATGVDDVTSGADVVMELKTAVMDLNGDDRVDKRDDDDDGGDDADVDDVDKFEDDEG